MRIFRLLVFVLSIVFGLTAYQPKVRAAEYYDNAQLNYIFSGSKFKMDGLYCSAIGGSNRSSPAELDITFRTDGTVAVQTKCVFSRGWTEKSSGNWIVENGSVCLNFRGQELINNVFSGTPQICRQAKQGRFGIELFASNGNREAYMKLLFHPKSSSKEELFIALKEPSKKTELAKLKQAEGQVRAKPERKQQGKESEDEELRHIAQKRQQPIAETKREAEQKQNRDIKWTANTLYYDNIQLNYIFSGSNFNISGLYCKSSAAVNMYDAEIDIIFKTDHTFTAEAVCFSRAQRNEKSSGNWKVENGSVCLNFKGQKISRDFYGQDGGTQICRRAKQGRFGIELFTSNGNREAYTKLISHPKAKSKEELFTALKTVPKEAKLTKRKQIEEQARKNRERQRAEELALREKKKQRLAQAKLKKQKQIEEQARKNRERQRAEELALRKREKERLAEVAKKRKVAQAKKTISQAKEKAEEAANWKVEEPKIEAENVALYTYAEKRVALVIGNSAYQYAPLPNPKNDAELMTKTLKGLGFDVITVVNASQKSMKKSVRKFGKKLDAAGKEGVGLFFYAGHGVQVRGANYLIPTDAQIETEGDVDIEAINAQSILSMMEFSGARLSFVIMDACRNNPFKRSFRSGTRGLAKMEAPTGSLVAYATAPGEVAADGIGKNSPYTMALARMMTRPGLSVERMFREVRNSVLQKTNSKQTPWESSSLVGGDFYFSRVSNPAALPVSPVVSTPKAVSPVDRNTLDLAFWNSVKDSTDAAMFEAYLEQYPIGSFAALARAKAKKYTQE